MGWRTVLIQAVHQCLPVFMLTHLWTCNTTVSVDHHYSSKTSIIELSLKAQSHWGYDRLPTTDTKKGADHQRTSASIGPPKLLQSQRFSLVTSVGPVVWPVGHNRSEKGLHLSYDCRRPLHVDHCPLATSCWLSYDKSLRSLQFVPIVTHQSARSQVVIAGHNPHCDWAIIPTL